MRPARWLGCLAAWAVVVAAAAAARADGAIARGAVVRIEHQEIYVNLGTSEGIGDGASIRLKRPVKLRHPITRAAIDDWIPIGSARVTQAGGRLSRAVIGKLVAAVRLGDVAEVFVDAPDAPPPPPSPLPPPRSPSPPQPPAVPPAAPVDPETAAVLAAFTAQSGLWLAARIAAWERYLSTHGGSRFADGVRRDLEALQALRDDLRPALTTRAGEVAVQPAEHAARKEIEAGQALPVVFVLARPEQVASAYLHYRTRDQRTYRSLLLAREHDVYLRGVVPAEVVRAPGVDYFVEVSTPNGRSGLALGSPAQPIAVEVSEPTLGDRFGDAPDRTTVVLAGELLDFGMLDNRPGDRRDVLYSGTVGVSYRLDTAVQRIGVGYGVIGGAGGETDAVYDDTNPLPRHGFHYGNVEVELGQREAALTSSLIMGVGQRGFGLGFEGRGRIGARDGANLVVAARRIAELGWSADVRLGARPAPAVGLGVVVGATDMPGRGDVAAKLATELEWVGHPNLSLLVRGSWQGRSSTHSGLGGGAAVAFTW